jgi:hypothetical protein
MPQSKREKAMSPRADFFTGIGLVVFSAVMFGIASRMPPAANYGLGPGGYPMLVSGVLILLGVILAVQGWLGIRRRASAQKPVLTLAEFKGIALLALSFWAYVFLMKYLGFLITTPVFLFLFLLQYGDRKWPRMVLTSLIATGISWALFTYSFRIFLPDFYFL